MNDINSPNYKLKVRKNPGLHKSDIPNIVLYGNFICHQPARQSKPTGVFDPTGEGSDSSGSGIIYAGAMAGAIVANLE